MINERCNGQIDHRLGRSRFGVDRRHWIVHDLCHGQHWTRRGQRLYLNCNIVIACRGNHSAEKCEDDWTLENPLYHFELGPSVCR